MKSIAVYCGSSKGKNEIYVNSAKNMGVEMVSRDCELIYGAGSVGLMGVIADSMLDLGGRVTGIIPQFLMDWEVGHTGLTRLEVTKDMHSRKKLIEELSDGFIAMPGGYGTLDELFEILTWWQLKLHDKPVGIYNVNGYFDGIISFMKHSVKEGFVKSSFVERVIVSEDPKKLLDGMSNWSRSSRAESKWI